MDAREQQINDIKGPRKNSMNLEFYAWANYHVGRPMKMSQKHRDLEIVVVMYLYSEEVTQAKKEGREEGRKEGFQRV